MHNGPRRFPARYLDVAEALLREAEGDFRGAVQVLQDTFDRPEVLTQNLSVDATLAPRLSDWPNEPATPLGPPPSSTAPTG